MKQELLHLLENDHEVKAAVFNIKTEQAEERYETLNSLIVRSVEKRLDALQDRRG